MKNIAFLVSLIFMLVPLSITQNILLQDENAIKKPALDYIEGWYTGDASRMESSLHPELAKRIVQTGPDGKSHLDSMGALTLVQRTRNGGGSKAPKDLQQKDITILDRFNNAAVVDASVVFSGSEQ